MSFSAQIGIDIGTTHSRVAIFKDGLPQMIANELASNLTPSYVAYTKTLCHVGDRARQQSAMNVENTIYSVRRLIGRGLDDPSVKEERKNVFYKINPANGRMKIQVDYQNRPQSVTPEETMALLIEKMVELGKNELKQEVKKAVITVPSQFTCSQRKAVKDAAAIAGIESELINETTAATLAYVHEKKSEVLNRRRTLLVYNMGGGFTTATIVVVTNQHISVHATAGDMQLGGDDLDQILVDHCCRQFQNRRSIDLKKIPRAVCRLRRACEKAKKDLSFSVQAEIEVDDICPNIDFEMHITRAEFDTMCDSLFKKAVRPVKKVLRDLNFPSFQIDDIILVGGSTRMPRLQLELRKIFNGQSLNLSVNQDEAAALGAAVHTARRIMFQDVVPEEFRVENFNGTAVLYPKNSPFPAASFYISRTLSINNDLIRVLQRSNNSEKEKFTIIVFKLDRKTSNCFDVQYKIDTDGILKVEAVLGEQRYLLKPLYNVDSLTEKDIASIRGELQQYRTDRFADSERILSKGSKENLLGFVDRLTAKLQNDQVSESEKDGYRSLRNTVNAWLADNQNATSAECELNLDRFKMVLAAIPKQNCLIKSSAATVGRSQSEEEYDAKGRLASRPSHSEPYSKESSQITRTNNTGHNSLVNYALPVEHSVPIRVAAVHQSQNDNFPMIDDDIEPAETHKPPNKQKSCGDSTCSKYREGCFVCRNASCRDPKSNDMTGRVNGMNLVDFKRTRCTEEQTSIWKF